MKSFFLFYKKKYNKNIKCVYEHISINYGIFIYKKNNNNFNYFFKSLNLFFKNGLLLKFVNYFCFYCYNFYLNFLRNNIFLLKEYTYLNEIKILIKNNSFFKNPLILFNWYYLYFNFIFSVKFLSNLKKKKKKKKFNDKIKYIFLNKNKRMQYFFKWLKWVFYLNYKKNLKNSINFLLNDIFLNFKQSKLYKYKLIFYKSLLN